MGVWQTKPIGEAFRVVNGGTPKTGVSRYWDGHHHWITPAEMGGLSAPYLSESRRRLTDEGLRVGAELVPKNSIILSTRAPIGHLVINEVPMAFNQGCKGLVPSAGIDTKFAYYFLLANVPLLESLGTGATFKELSGGKLKEVPFKYPLLPEQHRIAAILDEAFEGIASAKANAEKNLQNARELFETQLQVAFTGRELSWPEQTLGELGTITSSKRIFASEYTASGVPFFRTKEIKQLANSDEITTELYISRDRFVSIRDNFGAPKIGDLLLTAIGTIGEIYVVDDIGDFYFKDGNVLWLKDFKNVSPHYLKYALRSFVEGLNRLARGSAYSALPINKLSGHRIAVPPETEQRAIVKRLDTLDEACRQLEAVYARKVTRLDELEKCLLHRAFSGTLSAECSDMQLETVA